LFPELTFDLHVNDEFFNFAYKGSIKAGVADLHEDVEAMNSYHDMMEQACKEANQKYEAWKAEQAVNPKAPMEDDMPF
jgi:hypothetical protein